MELATLLNEMAHAIASVTESNRLEAELLLAHTLKITRLSLQRYNNIELSQSQALLLQEVIQRRQGGEPIAYITGQRNFWTLELRVDAHVLIPRPETELLVEQLLAHLPQEKSCCVVDLGTGCGAIALAVASERPHWTVYATDISQSALDIASGNAQNLQLETLHFVRSNWCERLDDHTFDAIVSNPPYIKSHEPHWHYGDLRFEPKQALVSGHDGLQAIDSIVSQASRCLIPGGFLLLEHGFQQAEAVDNMLKQRHYHSIQLYHDLAGWPRVTIAQYGFA